MRMRWRPDVDIELDEFRRNLFEARETGSCTFLAGIVPVAGDTLRGSTCIHFVLFLQEQSHLGCLPSLKMGAKMMQRGDCKRC